ncbi:MAG: hypothetical protein BWK80_36440 [Desulfobacteraceae bacterium IS3]|nr:MAG: hypothetical protein BWK80_36440 [Desulfobacteraceae bacterium IS3]HAO22155.1 hypothetical protein [Desulfobacteraceae bacterium]
MCFFNTFQERRPQTEIKKITAFGISGCVLKTCLFPIGDRIEIISGYDFNLQPPALRASAVDLGIRLGGEHKESN